MIYDKKSNKTLSKIAIFVAAISITFGSIAKLAPQLFFKIPNVGFIFYAMTGNILPPYFTTDMFDKPEEWLKDGDVIVSTGAKSGTTWMLFCSHQIRVKGNDEKYPFVDASVATPWPGLIQTPGDKWKDTWSKLNSMSLEDGTPLKQYWDHPDYPFRVFKAHDVPEEMGTLIGSDSSVKVKVLAMSRNGLDVVTSLTPFFQKHTDEFRKLWGGFPPPGKDDLNEEARDRLQQVMPGGMFAHLYFKYVNSWWEYKDASNVLLMHYSDAVKDLEGTVDKIADFYGVSLNKKEKATVVEKCSFPYMKKHKHMFNYKLPLNPNFKGTVMENGAIVRKGVNGDGKVMFTEEEQALWAKAEEQMFGDDPDKLNWARHGGRSF